MSATLRAWYSILCSSMQCALCGLLFMWSQVNNTLQNGVQGDLDKFVFTGMVCLCREAQP